MLDCIVPNQTQRYACKSARRRQVDRSKCDRPEPLPVMRGVIAHRSRWGYAIWQMYQICRWLLLFFFIGMVVFHNASGQHATFVSYEVRTATKKSPKPQTTSPPGHGAPMTTRPGTAPGSSAQSGANENQEPVFRPRLCAIRLFEIPATTDIDNSIFLKKSASSGDNKMIVPPAVPACSTDSSSH